MYFQGARGIPPIGNKEDYKHSTKTLKGKLTRDIATIILSKIILCIPESFNSNISHLIFDYTITFVNSQQ